MVSSRYEQDMKNENFDQRQFQGKQGKYCLILRIDVVTITFLPSPNVQKHESNTSYFSGIRTYFYGLVGRGRQDAVLQAIPVTTVVI